MKTESKILCVVVIVSVAYLAVPMIRHAISLDFAQIDKGIWYKKESPNGVSYLKGIAASNPYMDASEASARATNQWGFVSVEHGFGVSIERRDRFTMELLTKEGWHLFKSENEAVTFAREQFVPTNRIVFGYR